MPEKSSPDAARRDRPDAPQTARPADGKPAGRGSGRRAPRPRGPQPVDAGRAPAGAGDRPLPAISYPEDLPVSACRQQIARAIADHPVVIVCGETGSGKTTQLPKICLELGRGRQKMIGHTQPRRLAATSVAKRIAEELNTPMGEVVGYQVRFNDRTGPNASIKLMTDGILL
ncbi:MAG TPA: hypothetical protein VFM22_12920, partial [Castellaniella sp.]|nr:hypothetical protein [Castellaniella sp.]